MSSLQCLLPFKVSKVSRVRRRRLFSTRELFASMFSLDSQLTELWSPRKRTLLFSDILRVLFSP